MRAGRAGFTYVEMTLVIVIVSLLASLVVRNLANDQQTRAVWQFKRKLVAMGLQARTRAIESGDLVALYFSTDSGEDAKGTVRIAEEAKDGSRRDLDTLDLPASLSATRFDADRNEATGSEWRLPYYPDGANAGGGIEFQWGEQTFCLSVSRTAPAPRILDGELPDLSLEKWSAGGYEPRS